MNLKNKHNYIKIFTHQLHGHPLFTAEISFSRYDKACLDHISLGGLLKTLTEQISLITGSRIIDENNISYDKTDIEITGPMSTLLKSYKND